MFATSPFTRARLARLFAELLTCCTEWDSYPLGLHELPQTPVWWPTWFCGKPTKASLVSPDEVAVEDRCEPRPLADPVEGCVVRMGLLRDPFPPLGSRGSPSHSLGRFAIAVAADDGKDDEEEPAADDVLVLEAVV